MKIIKNRVLFYVLNLTWGLPLTIAGLLVTLVLLITGHKPKKHGYCWYFEIGKSAWGGVELGLCFLKDKWPDENNRIKSHEMGHGVQNCYFGPLMLFIVCLPSACWYWYREIIYRTNMEKYKKLPPYDSVWFEASATKLGNELYQYITEKKGS